MLRGTAGLKVLLFHFTLRRRRINIRRFSSAHHGCMRLNNSIGHRTRCPVRNTLYPKRHGAATRRTSTQRYQFSSALRALPRAFHVFILFSITIRSFLLYFIPRVESRRATKLTGVCKKVGRVDCNTRANRIRLCCAKLSAQYFIRFPFAFRWFLSARERISIFIHTPSHHYRVVLRVGIIRAPTAEDTSPPPYFCSCARLLQVSVSFHICERVYAFPIRRARISICMQRALRRVATRFNVAYLSIVTLASAPPTKYIARYSYSHSRSYIEFQFLRGRVEEHKCVRSASDTVLYCMVLKNDEAFFSSPTSRSCVFINFSSVRSKRLQTAAHQPSR